MKRRDEVPAEELMAELEADPDFVNRRTERERTLRCQETELRQAEMPLVEQLRSAGFEVESAWT